MRCTYPKEQLALYVEADLPAGDAEDANRHLARCAECREFCRQLQRSQTFLRSLRRNAVSSAALAGIHNAVLTQIGASNNALGWAVRIERFFLGSRMRYALAGIAILAIVSVTLFGQIRQRV